MSKPAPLSRTKKVRGVAVERADLDPGPLAVPGIFPGVAEQVLERDGQQPGIAFGDQVRRRR